MKITELVEETKRVARESRQMLALGNNVELIRLTKVNYLHRLLTNIRSNLTTGKLSEEISFILRELEKFSAENGKHTLDRILNLGPL